MVCLMGDLQDMGKKAVGGKGLIFYPKMKKKLILTPSLLQRCFTSFGFFSREEKLKL